MDTKEQKDKKLFNQIAPRYAVKDIYKSSRLARQYQLNFVLKPVLSKQKNLGNLLDVACGLGAPAEYLKGKYNNYIGIDQSEAEINLAREFNQGKHRVQFIASNIKNASLENNTADVVLAIGALHHMTELDEVLASLKKIAKPHAYFLGIEPNRSNFFIQSLRWLRSKIDSSYSEEQRYFSQKELNKLFVDNGFTDIKLTYQGFFSPPFAQVIIKPQFIATFLSKITIRIDKFLDKKLPVFLKKLSWNLVIEAKFPDK